MLVPERVWDAILTQGGVWAALFLLSVFISIGVIGLLWRALWEGRKAADEEIKRERAERIEELKIVLTVTQNNTRSMEERAKAIELQAQAVSEMSRTLTGAIIENKSTLSIIITGISRLEEESRRLWEVIRPSPSTGRRS